MTVLFRYVAMTAVLGSLMACSPSLIPGTPFPDTPDVRAILDIVAEYKNAYEAKDAKAIAALSSVHYMDRRDLISHDTLEHNLQQDFSRVKDVHLDIKVNHVKVDGDKAQVDYFYETSFQLATATAPWKQQSDDKRMLFRREHGAWKVTSGF